MSTVSIEPDAADQARLHEVVGYLNFSAGATDALFLENLNELYRVVENHHEPGAKTLDALFDWISGAATELHRSGGAFAEIAQVESVVRLVREEMLPRYRQFHRDLLWHRSEGQLWRPLLLGRVFEAVLAEGAPWDEIERIVPAAWNTLDNYIGYRPVATLETQKIEPYRHEWVAPLPLYIKSAGVGAGPYEPIIRQTLDILRSTPADLLADAWFDPELLEELALDPRAYDFDHPVNKRPNYHFGQWDPNRIDNKGYYRRFILQPLAIDSLLARVENAESLGREKDELLYEAAAVLAGTLLMASGTSGNGPQCHGSDVTLATLLPQIAGYRDSFYSQLLERTEGDHGQRLREEAKQMRQSFGVARQGLNQELARRRAVQLQRVHLAQVYARMGYADASLAEARSVRVASARMLCEIYCRLTAGHYAIDRRRLSDVAGYLDEITDLLNRGIECGALVDPWNILGFGANYSLFPAIENTVRDYRVDDLIQIVEQTLDLCSRAWAEAAARDDAELEKKFSTRLTQLSDWWDAFGAAQVSGVKPLVAKEIEISTNLVAGALNAWHKAGAASGDVKFWALFVDQFDTSKAFQLVIEGLLDKDDLVASMALMMQWISQVDYTPLEEGDASFHPLALRWLRSVEAQASPARDRSPTDREARALGDPWAIVTRFFAQLESSAEAYWHVPQFELGRARNRGNGDLPAGLDDEMDDDEMFDEELPYPDDEKYDADFEGDEEEGDELDNLFRAAYEDVTYRDSTDDGMDSAIYDPGEDETDYELEEESQRLRERLAFLNTVAHLWKQTATAWDAHGDAERREQLDAWHREAVSRYTQLIQLLEEVHQHRVPPPGGSHESMVEYDRRRMMLESLLEQIISTSVQMSDAGRLLRAAAGTASPRPEGSPTSPIDLTIEILRAVLTGDAATVSQHWSGFTESLVQQELLYVPLSRGGSPRRIVKARALHGLIHDLLGWLPRLGLVKETFQLLEVAQRMEIEHSVGQGAITEYDRLFETGYQALVRCVVTSADSWDGQKTADDASRPSDNMLVEALQDLTESQLGRWLTHSRTVRLSVVEKLTDEEDWRRFVRFVERYGHGLFTQRFLSLGNLRSILHQGTMVWLSNQELESPEELAPLLEEIGGRIPREEAVEMLAIAIESVVENYREYRDYNATTTQSDHGELLHAFVDFLRLRANYDRSAWNMKPVFLAHEILIRQRRDTAAQMWREAVAERTADAADHYLKRFHQLSEQYGMRLPTIAERLGERFTRSLAVDRLRALVAPAIQAVDSETGNREFKELEQEIATLVDEPCGAGLDVPDWVAALEEEVTVLRRCRRHHQEEDSLLSRIEQVPVDWETLQSYLEKESDSAK